jgi:hypothetical protein
MTDVSTKKASEFEKFDLLAELDIDNNQFKTQLLQLVLKAPEKYYDLRNRVQKQLLRKSTQQIYNLLLNFMYDGGLPANDGEEFDQMYIMNDGLAVPLYPHIPLAQCKPKALATAQAVAKLLMDVMDEVLPSSHLDLATKEQEEQVKLTQK